MSSLPRPKTSGSLAGGDRVQRSIARPELVSAVVIAVAVLWGSTLGDGYTLTVAFNFVLLASLGLGYTLVLGLGGLLVLNYPAFYATGAYVSAILMLRYDTSFLVAALTGAAAAAVIGLLVGLICLRFAGIYLAIVTLALGLSVNVVIRNLPLTGGANGLNGIPIPTIFGITLDTALDFYYAALIFMIVVAAVVLAVKSSRFGLRLVATRDDRLAAETAGLNTVRTRLAAFMIGAIVAGIAGALLAVQQTAISPNNFGVDQTILILSIVVVGGLGSIPGTIIAAAIFTILPEFMNDLTRYETLAFSILLLLVLLVRPQGLWPTRPVRGRSGTHSRCEVVTAEPQELSVTEAGRP